ncbi:hypothetical protein P5673_006804 [Acropora cervicornis]|uniref:Uncharacterized protein n=1 Tax=Acropora cervicornis TaxID=6130 RepID=A0AAD9QWL8_ACRCE|nr:hypothetical protein P5673_006804 [Acropora cervicornis]
MTDSLENKGRFVVPKVPQSGNKQSNPRTLQHAKRGCIHFEKTYQSICTGVRQPYSDEYIERTISGRQ